MTDTSLPSGCLMLETEGETVGVTFFLINLKESKYAHININIYKKHF